MKVYLALMVAVIGVGMVAAEENLKSKLQMALKSMIDDIPAEKKEDLEMETRDSLARCERDTNECDGHGECSQSTFGRNYGQYICFCEVGYRTNFFGGCSPTTAREVEYLSNIARDVELEMLTRDSLRRCNQDTDQCDGFGQCQMSTFGRNTGQYTCLCEAGYKNNLYGGCSPITKREMEYLAMLSRDVQLETLARKSFSECNQETNDCDGYGECVEDTHGEYLCVCGEDYENNLYGGCSPIAKRAEKVDQEDETYVAGRKKEIMRQLAELLEEE